MSESSITPDVKMYIVVRKDLKMSHGKEDAQVGHAVMAFICRRMSMLMEFGKLWGKIELSAAEVRWLSGGLKTKIVLEVNSEEELLALDQAAKAAGLSSHLIQDAGLTVFNGVPTYTCLAIGPDFVDKIKPITDKLKLRK